ncbi:MAG: class I SAM-dependent methyltransferase [Leptolyngbyaceae cyanobacterium SL_5_14]|nr:class I SAM-dependent methyltransferase [Leptolyngbyaceae cyanobacterium SL_5_14]NJO66944.1 class I SAM-dependent methyltransferase [Leptolyngbyaceae cyanobacterium RM1_405_57]
MTSTTLDLKNAPGHQVLAAAGKKILRPGGRAATEQLFEWANFQPGETVLELASSFGYSAIALAQQYGVRVVGVEKNPSSVARARENVAIAGLTNQIEIIEGDILQLQQISGSFDYVLAEAILTMQPAIAKAKILSGIASRLKPGGTFLAHELLASNQQEKIHRDLAQAIRVNATPLSDTEWISTIEASGLKVIRYSTGAMSLLQIPHLIQDEGIITTIQILWNVLTHPQIRQRVLAMRRTFQRYSQDLGYIIFSAQRNS